LDGLRGVAGWMAVDGLLRMAVVDQLDEHKPLTADGMPSPPKKKKM